MVFLPYIYTATSFAIAAMSSVGLGTLSSLPWCVLSILCNTTHVKAMCPTTFGLCPIVPNRTLKLLARI